MMLKCKKYRIAKRMHLNINGEITKDYIKNCQNNQTNQNKFKDAKEVSFLEEKLKITNEKNDIFFFEFLLHQRYFL